MLEWIPVDSLQVANSSLCHAAVFAGLCDDGLPIPAQFKYRSAGCVSIRGLDIGPVPRQNANVRL